MKGFKILLLLFLLTIFSLPLAQPTYACSCLPSGTPKEELAKVDAVFSGEVVSVKEKFNSTKQVKIKVKKSWKGIEVKEVRVHTSNDSASCGVNFEQGKEYIIYAHLEEGNYTTYLCSRTAELTFAQLDLQELGKAVVPIKSNSATDTAPSTHNLVIGSVSLFLVLGGCFFYRWRNN